MTKPAQDLSFADIRTFLAVVRLSSLSGAARELNVTPSQVSKAISRLERAVKLNLLRRGGRSVGPSEAGKRAVEVFTAMTSGLMTLQQSPRLPRPQLTVGAPSYLNHHFLPLLARALPGIRFRGIELPPSLLRAYAADNFFDVTLTAGPTRLPPSWQTTEVGQIRRALYASPQVARALGDGPVAPAKLHALPFITPVFYADGQFRTMDDGCPLGHGERETGHEVSTIAFALELARRSDQLVYGPSVVAKPYVDRGELEEIEVEGWASSEPMFVGCNMDRVLARVQEVILTTLRVQLELLQEPLTSPKGRPLRRGAAKRVRAQSPRT